MLSAKEAASNVAAFAKAGMEKTKAVLEEKAEKMTTRDPVKKQMAEEKKEARIHEAERMKHETRAHNEAARQAHGHGGGLTGTTDYATGTRGTTTGGGDPAYGMAPEGPFSEEHASGATRGVVSAKYPSSGTHTGTSMTGARDPRT